MLKSLSAKIIAAALVLITVSYVADFVIAAGINETLRQETSALTTRMQDAIGKKDDLIANLLGETLAASERSLTAVHTEATATTMLDTEKTRKYLEGTRNGIAVSSLTLIRNAMMMGEAATAQNMMDTLLENPDIYAINLWRASGELAFRDNKTINAINKAVGGEAFVPRKPLPAVRIDGERAQTFKKVVETRQNGLTSTGEIENDSGGMEPVEYAYYVFENAEECQDCHGGSAEVLQGVLEVAVSRRALIDLEAGAQAKMAQIEAAQRTEKDKLNAEITAKANEVKSLTDAVTADVAQGQQHVSDAQDSATLTSVLSKAGFFAATVGVLFWVLNTLLSRPVAAMTNAMGRLANGDLSAEVPAQGREDEIGEMAAAVQVFKENAQEMRRLEAEQAETEQRARRDKALAMKALADDFESNVGAVVKTVSKASNGMEMSAESLAKTAEKTSGLSENVAAASERASQNVATVASASEELSAAISEISRQVSQSTQIAGAAVMEVESANDKVRGLAEAAQKIGEVVALITDIADQTNLLALNATIEAARAGEAGKGFAVVASEVKNLANQTAKATEEISSHIGGIQGATNEAVAAIESIGGTITQMNEITSAIAAAVEEQGAATQEIARNVEHAANGTGEVSDSIREVNRAAEDTGVAATDIRDSAHDLSQQSARLSQEVEKFLKAIRPKDADLA